MRVFWIRIGVRQRHPVVDEPQPERVRHVGRFCSLLALGFALMPLGAQGLVDKLPPELHVKRTAGDSVQPAYEGWRRNPDGTVSMWFGYLNRNLEERVNVPVGPNNRFDPPMDDRGQPAYFYPGFHQFVFRVDLPKEWDKDKKLVWTLTANGTTLTANGLMTPGYEVDNGVIAMNLSPGGNAVGNAAPVIDGPSDQDASVGVPLKLVAAATDDGLPKPRAGRTTRPAGIRIRWEEYRGPGDVGFEPENTSGQFGQPVESVTKARFSAPGTYWLRAVGFDGQLESTYDFKVTVSPAHP